MAMNAVDILTYGHGTVQQALDGLTDAEWEREGACGVWSIKDIVAHLASFEHVLEDVLYSFLGGGPTPYLDDFRRLPPDQFNGEQVARRKGMTPRDVAAEYAAAHARTLSLLERIPEETRRQAGTLPWYGDGYALDDFIVYAYYGHKREHSAQIALMRDRLASAVTIS